MSESQKKNQKEKHEPKEQRKQGKAREGKQQKNPSSVSKAEAKSKKNIPEHQEPPSEFYTNLKRETDEILKITEEADAKYKKKEIQSNWAKYEMPIETYEEIEAENMGADFEQLIQASMSVGGHFQFKHEKSWDQCTAASLYDKYFDINCEDLATCLYTIPFYERNCIDLSLFSQTDIQNMDSRTNRYKQKYFNDNTFTPEADAQEKNINSLKEGLKLHVNKDTDCSEPHLILEEKLKINSTSADIPLKSNKDQQSSFHIKENRPNTDLDDDIDNIIFGKVSPETLIASPVQSDYRSPSTGSALCNRDVKSKENTGKKTDTAPVMESPEDLDKWLDDFLDD